MRMSTMSMFTMKPKDAMANRIEEEDAIGNFSSRPLSINEASIDH